MERTIRSLFLVMALAILYISIPAAVYAENIYGGGVKIGNIYYELDEENRTAAVACPPYKRIYNLGGGYEPEYLDYYEGDIIIPETVLNDGFEYSVTTIGESAFAYQDLVSSVAMPNSITQIMSSAFSASGIEFVTIPSSVTYIGSYIAPYAKELVYNAENAEFVNLGSGIFKPFGYNITKLTIGEDVKILDGRVFRNNTKLTDLYYNAIDCEITYDFEESTWNRISPFSESVTNLVLGDHVKRIPDYAFCGLQNVECVVLPDSLEEIGENGFLGCGLNVNTTTSITIPKSVKRLENGSLAISNVREVIFNAECCEMNVIGQILEFPVGVFLWNTIEKLTIGNDVKRIPDRAFPLFKISTVDIPEGVESIGKEAFYGCALQSVALPESLLSIGCGAFFGSGLRSVDIPDGVEYIGEQAFYWSRLKSVKIPESLKSIGKDAFEHCDSLTELAYNAIECEFADSNTPFSRSIEKLHIGDKVKVIPDYAFRYTGISSVVFPSSVEFIGAYSFESAKLCSVTIPENVKLIGEQAFANCSDLSEINYNAVECDIKISLHSYVFPKNVKNLTIGENVRIIPACAFIDFAITSITIPSSVMKIGYSAFYGCESLNEVNTESLSHWAEIDFQSLDANPIYYAKTLFVRGEEIPRRVVIPDGIKRIGNGAFASCENLVSVSIPKSVNRIGACAFYGCSGLQRVVFPSMEKFLAIDYDSDMCHVDYGNNANIYIDSEPLDRSEVKVPEGMTRIPDYTFFGWSDLKTIIIPETVTDIGKYAFGNCKKLHNVKLPSNLRIIEEGTFLECENLGNMIIPAMVDSIGSDAFSKSKLYSVVMPASLKYIGKDAFDVKKIGDIDVADMNSWAKIEFVNEKSNPLTASGTIRSNGKLVHHVDINIDNDSVSDYAFWGAEYIKTVRIKASSIGPKAFKDCSSLESICIDADAVMEDAFIGDAALTNLYVPRSIPPTAHNNAFSKYDGVNLYVPVGSLDAYENAENCWWKFLDIHESDFKDLDEIFKADYGNIPVESIMLTPDSWSGEEGESFTIVATILPENATDKSLTWTSDDEAVAKVDSEGRVSVLREGSCVITATATDGSGVYAECIVTGVSGIEEIFSTTDQFDLYDLNGILIKKDSDREDLKLLTPGIYIILIGDTVKKIVIR